jgi:hypothetical protein
MLGNKAVLERRPDIVEGQHCLCNNKSGLLSPSFCLASVIMAGAFPQDDKLLVGWVLVG